MLNRTLFLLPTVLDKIFGLSDLAALFAIRPHAGVAPAVGLRGI